VILYRRPFMLQKTVYRLRVAMQQGKACHWTSEIDMVGVEKNILHVSDKELRNCAFSPSPHLASLVIVLLRSYSAAY